MDFFEALSIVRKIVKERSDLYKNVFVLAGG
jgi:hypothetical protein